VTERTFQVGTVVYQRPKTKTKGIPRSIDMGEEAWVITEILDKGLVRIRLESGTTMGVVTASILVTAEEQVAEELMGEKWPCDYVGCWPPFSVTGNHCSGPKIASIGVTCRRGHRHQICNQAYDLLELGTTGREMPCFDEDFCLSCLRTDTELYRCKDCDACHCSNEPDCAYPVYTGHCDHMLCPMKHPRRTL